MDIRFMSLDIDLQDKELQFWTGEGINIESFSALEEVDVFDFEVWVLWL